MKKELLKLASWLFKNSQQQEGEQVQELSQYEEPWHEEAVKEFGGEPITEEEYLKEHFRAKPGIKPFEIRQYHFDRLSSVLPEEIYNKIFEKENFVPVLSGKSTILGGGKYGAVFSGVYQGKPAAAKVIHDIEGSSEIDKWRKVLEAKEQMPPELQKHFPEIYHLNSDCVGRDIEPEKDVETEEDITSFLDFVEPTGLDEYCYEIIIMERLRQPTKHMIDAMKLYITRPFGSKLINQKLKEPEYLYEIAKNVSSLLSSQVLPRDIFKIIYGIKPITHENYQNFVMELAKRIIKEYGKGSWGEPERLSKLFETNLRSFFRPMPFPSMHGKNEILESVPEVRDFYLALRELGDEYSIYWKDLHEENFMIGNDDNIKVIDVGLFDVPF